MELTEVAREQVQYAVDRLNHRPRKMLGLKTPFEVFFGKTVRYTMSPLVLALRNWIHGSLRLKINVIKLKT
jgi:IS30 family transposase